MSKLIYAQSLSGFQTAFNTQPKLDAINQSIVFIADGYLWTHGKYFRIFDSTNPFDISYAAGTNVNTGNIVSLTDKDNNVLTTFDVGVTSVTGDGVVVAGELTNGAVALSHVASTLTAGTYGASAASADSIAVISLVTNASGHIVTGTTTYTATLNQVKATVIGSGNYYLVGHAATTAGTAETLKHSSIYGTVNGYLYATRLYGRTMGQLEYTFTSTLNGSATTFNNTASTSVSFYAPTGSGNAGELLKSNGTGVAPSWFAPSQSITSSSTHTEIPTSKAVWDVIGAGLSAADAMVFMGTLGTTGTITALPTTGFYSAGNTYRVVTAGTYAGVVCEIGDLIVCVKDRAAAEAGVNSDWTVVQTNIDGAVVGPTSATNGAVVLFDQTSGKLIKDSTKVLSTVGGNLLSLANPGAVTFIRINADNTVTARSATDFKTDLSLNNVENTALSTWAGTTNITTVGTIGTGTWNATNISLGKGGTNATLTAVAGGIVYSTSSALAISSAGSANQVLLSGGISAPTWTNQASLSVGSATNATNSTYATNIAGGSAGQVLYQSAANTTAFVSTTGISTGYVLKWNGSAPVWGVDVDTNTHYTTKLVVAATNSGTADAIATNGNVYLNLFDDSTLRNSHNITGTGSVSVTSNASGNITINGTDTNTWRNVSAYIGATLAERLSTTIGGDDLQFGSEFEWDTTNKEIKLGWAEVAINGTITYTS